MHVWNFKERRRLFTLHGHSGTVWDLVYTPEGDRLISAGNDNLIRVWDATTSQEAVSLSYRPPDEEVWALTYSRSGKLIAWGDIRGRTGVWDTVLGKEVLRIDDPKPRGRNPVLSMVFSPDERLLAWRRRNCPATLWDLDQAAEIPLPARAPVDVLGLTFSADGKRLLGASFENETLQVHDLRTGEELLALPRPGSRVYHVVWSPDAACMATNEDRKYARLWAADTGRPLGEVEYQPSLTNMAFSADGGLLAVGGLGGGVRVWDLKANQERMAVTGHSSRVYALAFSPDGRRLASSAADCTAKLWDTQTGDEVLTLRTQLHEHSPLAFSPDGTDLVSVTMDNQLQIWSTRQKASNTAIEAPAAPERP
jgi:WD40 repeat protein